MSEYTQTLAQLTEEEQRIYAKDWRDRSDFQRLATIQQARELLWNVERARKAGAPLSEVPLDGWRCDKTGFVMARPPRDRTHYKPRRDGPKLPRGVERTASGRLRATVWLSRTSKLSLGTFEETPEQIALAARMAEAGRQARDAGGGEGEIQAAVLAIYQQEHAHATAAD